MNKIGIFEKTLPILDGNKLDRWIQVNKELDLYDLIYNVEERQANGSYFLLSLELDKYDKNKRETIKLLRNCIHEILEDVTVKEVLIHIYW